MAIIPRPDRPRLEPLGPDDVTDDLAGWVGPQSLNIMRTIAHHPDLLGSWTTFGAHVLLSNTLSSRHRELAVLRVGWNCSCEYEFGQHSLAARRAGMTDVEIAALTTPLDQYTWSPDERSLLEAVDELCAHRCISDVVWEDLQDHLDDKQILDLIFTVGQYSLVSMALNTLGIELDPHNPGFPT